MIRKSLIATGLLAVLTLPAMADTNVRVVVPAHDIGRGDVLSESDLNFGTVPGTALMNGTITSLDAARGMEARRVLRAGETISTNDLRRPVVVNKGQTVTMT